MNITNDDDTITTTASSFVQVGGIGGDVTTTTTTTNTNSPPLSVSIQPRHDSIGLDAMDAVTHAKYITNHVCVTLKAHDTANDNDDQAERAPADILVALDVSGSMRQRSKIELCKETLEKLVRALQPQDRFGLITYASQAVVALPLQRLTDDYKAKCFNVIRRVTTRDSTNISAALGLAAQEMRMVESPNQVRAIILLTDGHANEGICSPTGLVQLVQNCVTGNSSPPVADDEVDIQTRQGSGSGFMGWTIGFSSQRRARPASAPTPPAAQEDTAKPAAQVDFTTKSQIPISLHTFGYGQNHNEDLLQQLANSTEGGTYYFVEDDKGVNTAFADAIGGIVSTTVQNAVVRLQVPPSAAAMGVQIEKVHHDQAIARENGSYTVTVGDLYAEESRDVVLTVQLAVPTTATDAPIPHVSAQVFYTDTLQRRPVESATVTANIARPTGTGLSIENDHVAAQWLRVFSVEQMALADAYADASNFAAAQESLAAVSNTFHMQSRSVQCHSESTSIFQTSLAMADDMSAGLDEYRRVGKKRAKQSMQTHRSQRSVAMTTPRAATAVPSPYETKSKNMWRDKFA